MVDPASAGKLMVIAGLLVAALGMLLVLGARMPFLGRLPGDIFVQRGNSSFYFPIVTSILLSLLLTVVFNLAARR